MERKLNTEYLMFSVHVTMYQAVFSELLTLRIPATYAKKKNYTKPSVRNWKDMCAQHQYSIQMHYEFLYCGFDQHTCRILPTEQCLLRSSKYLFETERLKLPLGFTFNRFYCTCFSAGFRGIQFACHYLRLSYYWGQEMRWWRGIRSLAPLLGAVDVFVGRCELGSSASWSTGPGYEPFWHDPAETTITGAANILSVTVLPVSSSVCVPLISLCTNRSYLSITFPSPVNSYYYLP